MIEFHVVKCLNCGYSKGLKNGKFPPGWKLKIVYDKNNDEITILGNAAGLEFLADTCLRIIGKTDPGGHMHLQWEMNNLLEGSTSTLVEFSDTNEHYSD